MSETFLSTFPSSKHNESIREHRDRLQFNLAQKENTPEAYQNFVTSFPDNRFLAEGKKKWDESSFLKAESQDTTAGYQAYLRQFPSGAYVDEAHKKIAALELKPYLAQNTIAGYEEYLRLFPDEPWRKDAREKANAQISLLEWQPYEQQNTTDAYRSYLQKYPDNPYRSPYRKKAREFVSQVEYKPYRDKDTRKAYKDFLEKYGSSHPLAQDAKDRHDQLLLAEAERTTNLRTMYGLVSKALKEETRSTLSDKFKNLLRKNILLSPVEISQTTQIVTYEKRTFASSTLKPVYNWFGEVTGLESRSIPGNTTTYQDKKWGRFANGYLTVKNTSPIPVQVTMTFVFRFEGAAKFLEFVFENSGLEDFIVREDTKSLRLRPGESKVVQSTIDTRSIFDNDRKVRKVELKNVSVEAR